MKRRNETAKRLPAAKANRIIAVVLWRFVDLGSTW
jgi:hypothetical protein